MLKSFGVDGASPVSTTPSGFVVAATCAGAAGTSSGTIVAMFDTSLFAVVASFTTA